MKYGNDEGQGRVMKNPFLEALTKTPIWLPLTVYYTISAVMMGLCIFGFDFKFEYVQLNPFIALLIWFVGLLAFSLLEYAAHRHVFHMHADTEKKKRIQYMFHGVHHDYPRDKDRLSMPVFISIFLAILFFALFRVTMGVYGYAFGAGFVAGYATYLFAHYAIHRFKPPRNFLKQLWIHHNIHHYAAPKAAFGVSTIIWDRVFNTMPPEMKKK